MRQFNMRIHGAHDCKSLTENYTWRQKATELLQYFEPNNEHLRAPTASSVQGAKDINH